MKLVIPGPAAGRNPESRMLGTAKLGWIPGSVLRTAPE